MTSSTTEETYEQHLSAGLLGPLKVRISEERREEIMRQNQSQTVTGNLLSSHGPTEGITRANQTQVGGTHYRQGNHVPQHWDLAVIYDWDPFQYQITKYVMRWKTKHDTPEKKLEDLKKAAHFLQKYIEVQEAILIYNKTRSEAVLPARAGIGPQT